MRHTVTHRIRSRRLLTAPYQRLHPQTPSSSNAGLSGPAVPYVVRHQRSRRALQAAGFVFGGSQLRPLTAATPAVIHHPKANRIEHQTKLLKPLELDQYPVTPPSTALDIVLLKALKRFKPTLLEITKYEVIFDTHTAPVYPIAAMTLKVNRRHGWRRGLRVGQPPSTPETPKTAATPATIAHPKPIHTARSEFRVQNPPEIDRYPITYPWSAAFYRRPQLTRKPLERALRKPLQLNQWTVTPPRAFAHPSVYAGPRAHYRDTTHRQHQFVPWHFLTVPLAPLAAVRSGMNAGPIYLVGAIHPAAYMDSGMSDVLYVRSGLESGTVYVEGNITDAAYLMGDIFDGT